MKNEKIIDLTMTIEEGMQTFIAHWHPFVEITQMGRHGIENRETRKLVLGTHTGTHMDAPRHFIKEGACIDAIMPDNLIGEAKVLDFSHADNFQEISKSDIQALCRDGVPQKIIFRFDWDKKALGTNYYYTDHPYLAADACQWLVDEGCHLVALDTPQPDNPKNGYGTENDAPNHRIILGGGAALVEYLVNLHQLTHSLVQFIVAPLKIKDGDGAPARCFAIEREVA